MGESKMRMERYRETRRAFLERTSMGVAGLPLASPHAVAEPPGKYQVGAYYFPNFHVDRRNETVHGPGWTEWELVKRAEPKFPGHRQPKKPAWGYEDEADPRVFEKKIAAAADHGLTHFIFDWYWYNDGPFLQRCLEDGYLNASNNRRLKFCLMWANHDWVDIQPAKRKEKPPLQYPGRITVQTFERMTDHIISKYFSHPSYWTIGGRPYFSVYELFKLVESFGGIEPARKVLDGFRRKAQAAGFPDLHLNAITWGVQVLPGEQNFRKPREVLSALGFDSVTSYVWIHHVRLPQFPVTPYSYVGAEMAQYWSRASEEYGLPYHPNVTMGWDSSPRTCQSDVFTNSGYPFMPTMGGNSPAAFRAALESVKSFLESRPDRPRILNVNAWNEWTEGSYLEPDAEHGMAYLEAIQAVFGSA